tara:strand:- start:68 stop:208 length:141 start_codon:yes stop_codon:yes gene_type:complete
MPGLSSRATCKQTQKDNKATNNPFRLDTRIAYSEAKYDAGEIKGIE